MGSTIPQVQKLQIKKSWILAYADMFRNWYKFESKVTLPVRPTFRPPSMLFTFIYLFLSFEGTHCSLRLLKSPIA